MLQKLNVYFSKWLVAFLLGMLGVLLIAEVLLYSPLNIQSQVGGKVIARVNKAKIHALFFEQMYEMSKEHYLKKLGRDNLTVEEAQFVRFSILQELINTEIVKQAAYQQGYRAHPQTVLNVVKKEPAFQVDGQFSSSRFKMFLRKSGNSKKALLNKVAEQDIIFQAQTIWTQMSFILPHEIRAAARLMLQQRDFSYIQLPAHHFLPSTASLSKEDIKDYYDQHLTQFRVSEKVSIDYIALSRLEIVEQCKKTIPDNQKVAESKANQEFQKALNALKASKSTHSLKAVAQSLQIPIQTTSLFERTGGDTTVTRHPEVIKAAFHLALHTNKEVALIQIDEDHVICLTVKDYRPLRLATLEEVEPRVREQLSIQQSKEAVKKQGEAFITQMKKDAHLTQLPDHLRWQKMEKVQRDNRDIDPLILDTVFSMPWRDNSSNVAGMTLSNGDYVVIQLTKVRSGKLSLLADEPREAFRNNVYAIINQKELSQYLLANYRRAKIVYANSTI